jgi:hypothetical protein
MFCKVFARGGGRASGIDYLLAERDANKKLRTPPAELLRGDPELIKQVIANLNFSRNYTSGVLSFTETVTELTRDNLQQIIDEFEEMVKAGFDDPGRIDMLWVLHQDKDRAELHWVVANVDLETSKRFQPYYHKVDLPRFRAWERLTNATYGLTDPSDPARARTINIPTYLPDKKADQYKQINDAITNMVAQGQITNRDQIVTALSTAGYQINRLSQDYLSIQDPDGRKLRLKGAFYGQSFTSIESLERPTGADQTTGRTDHQHRLRELRTELDRQLEKRSQYVQSRYCRVRPATDHNYYQPPSNPFLSANRSSTASPPDLENISMGRSQSVGIGASELNRDANLGNPSTPMATSGSGQTPPISQLAPVEYQTPTTRANQIEQTQPEIADDRIRANAIELTRTISHRIETAGIRFNDQNRQLDENLHQLNQASTELNRHTNRLSTIRPNLQAAQTGASGISRELHKTATASRKLSHQLGQLTDEIAASTASVNRLERQHTAIEIDVGTIARQMAETERWLEREAAVKQEQEQITRVEVVRPKPAVRERLQDRGGMSM